MKTTVLVTSCPSSWPRCSIAASASSASRTGRRGRGSHARVPGPTTMPLKESARRPSSSVPVTGTRTPRSPSSTCAIACSRSPRGRTKVLLTTRPTMIARTRLTAATPISTTSSDAGDLLGVLRPLPRPPRRPRRARAYRCATRRQRGRRALRSGAGWPGRTPPPASRRSACAVRCPRARSYAAIVTGWAR